MFITSDSSAPRAPRSLLKYLAIVLGLLVLAFASLFLVDPVKRAQSYLRANTYWIEHWPFYRGKYILTRAQPLLRSTGLVAPVRYNVEPGVSFLLDPLNLIDSTVLLTGHFDKEVWGWIDAGLRKGSTFVDVGVQIGTMTIYGAKAVGPAGRVIAVEPNPSTLKRLRDNIAASGWLNVTVEPVACGAASGRLRLYLGPETNTGVTSLSKENAVAHGGSGQTVDVDILRLDDIVARQGLNRIDVIKIDTEGAETQVLTGARESILRFHPVIVLETIESQLVNMGSSKAELESLLRSYGYHQTRVDSDRENEEWRPASSN